MLEAINRPIPPASTIEGTVPDADRPPHVSRAHRHTPGKSLPAPAPGIFDSSLGCHFVQRAAAQHAELRTVQSHHFTTLLCAQAQLVA